MKNKNSFIEKYQGLLDTVNEERLKRGFSPYRIQMYRGTYELVEDGRGISWIICRHKDNILKCLIDEFLNLVEEIDTLDDYEET